VKAFVYGCAMYADEMDLERMKAMAGGGATRAAMGG
jgi:hypothetical protein